MAYPFQWHRFPLSFSATQHYEQWRHDTASMCNCIRKCLLFTTQCLVAIGSKGFLGNGDYRTMTYDQDKPSYIATLCYLQAQCIWVMAVFALGLDIVKSWDLKRCVYFESLNFGLSDGAAVTARRRRAQLGGSGGMPPRENLYFCIQFGAFWGFLRG